MNAPHHPQIRRFRQAPWLRGRHAQTIGGRYVRRKRGVRFRRERIDTPDGDFVHIDFADVPGATWADLGDSAPIVVLFHGLEGSARTGYAYETYRLLAGLGVRAVGLNFRSCSGEPNLTPRLYHSGDNRDAALVIDLLRERFGDVPFGGIGVSLGGNVLLKHLGERSEDTQLSAAVGISVPFDLEACANELEEKGGGVYTWYLLKQLTDKLRADLPRFGPALPDIQRALNAKTFRQFDNAVTAPIHGFTDAGDYYRQSSSKQFLERIRVPTLLMSSADDPFLPSDAMPHAEVAANPLLTAAFTEHGGHVGFVTGAPWRRVFWAEQQGAAFLAHHLLS